MARKEKPKITYNSIFPPEEEIKEILRVMVKIAIKEFESNPSMCN